MKGRRSALLMSIAVATAWVGAATAQTQPEMEPPKLRLLEIKTNDFQQARRFYMDVVGLKQNPGSRPDGKPKQTMYLSFGGSNAETSIVISHDDGDGNRVLRAGVLQRVAFQVTDVVATVQRARAAGAPVVREPASAHGDPNLIVAFVRDPDGNLVEFVQHPKK